MASGERLIANHNGTKRDVLRLTAWMPNGFAHYEIEGSDADLDSFEKDVCDGCNYYFDRFDDHDADGEDSDGNHVDYISYLSCCPCRRDGIDAVHWPCAAGYDEPAGAGAGASSGSLPPMAFATDLHPTIGHSFAIHAWLQAADPIERTVSDRWRSINCFDTDAVCWGQENDAPGTLPEAVVTYGDAPCNADLLQPAEFISNINAVRRSETTNSLLKPTIGPGYDAVLLVHAAEQPAAYLLLRGSGYEASKGLIVAGLHQHCHDGIDGFITDADAHGRCWFLTYADDLPDADNGLKAALLGQIPHPDPSCSSPAPSSLELVAAAAS